jgi:nicotinamidase-related amidase
MDTNAFKFHLRSQALDRDANGHAYWRVVRITKTLPANHVAIVICDMWDKHWSRGATERVGAMVPRMNAVVEAARAKGAFVVHAPSETMPFYERTPARQRMRNYPFVEPPPPMEHGDPPLPVDAGDHGSDTGETEPHRAWQRQHPELEIDQTRDGVTDSGEELYNFLAAERIEQVLIMGVHTNMCVLGRSFAIKPLVRRGVNVALVRDLTDTMYNPAMSPYVSHNEGTRLVVGYIEKHWCPSIASADLLR